MIRFVILAHRNILYNCIVQDTRIIVKVVEIWKEETWALKGGKVPNKA